MALQCPRCELRFDLAPILADHLATDHALPPEQTTHLQPPSVRIGQVPPPADRDDATGRVTRADPSPDGAETDGHSDGPT